MCVPGPRPEAVLGGTDRHTDRQEMSDYVKLGRSSGLQICSLSLSARLTDFICVTIYRRFLLLTLRHVASMHLNGCRAPLNGKVGRVVADESDVWRTRRVTSVTQRWPTRPCSPPLNRK